MLKGRTDETGSPVFWVRALHTFATEGSAKSICAELLQDVFSADFLKDYGNINKVDTEI